MAGTKESFCPNKKQGAMEEQQRKHPGFSIQIYCRRRAPIRSPLLFGKRILQTANEKIERKGAQQSKMKTATIMKRVLAWLLIAAMLVGLLPTYALAAQPQTETATVEVNYTDADRTGAEIRYHKEGIAADPVNLIFLVDTSAAGKESHEAFETMLRNDGLDYIYDYGVNTNTRLISYQNEVFDSGGNQSGRDGLLDAINDHSTPTKALAQAKGAVEDMQKEEPDAPTVVFWVLGDRFGRNEDDIEAQVKALSEALGEDGALINLAACRPAKRSAHQVRHPSRRSPQSGCRYCGGPCSIQRSAFLR